MESKDDSKIIATQQKTLIHRRGLDAAINRVLDLLVVASNNTFESSTKDGNISKK